MFYSREKMGESGKTKQNNLGIVAGILGFINFLLAIGVTIIVEPPPMCSLSLSQAIAMLIFLFMSSGFGVITIVLGITCLTSEDEHRKKRSIGIVSLGCIIVILCGLLLFLVVGF